jgi:hypothetical protein
VGNKPLKENMVMVKKMEIKKCEVCNTKLSILRDFGCWSFYCKKCNKFKSETFSNDINPDNVEEWQDPIRMCKKCGKPFVSILNKQWYCIECLDEPEEEEIFTIEIDEDTTDAEYDEFFSELERWCKA